MEHQGTVSGNFASCRRSVRRLRALCLSRGEIAFVHLGQMGYLVRIGQAVVGGDLFLSPLDGRLVPPRPARYLKVATNESLMVAGLYSAAPVKTVGERLCYSFGVPVSGCKVLKTDTEPKQPVVPKKPAVIDSAPQKEPTNVVVKTSSFLCVVKYKDINGERKTISHREYRGHNFKSPKEFDRFCQEEFARIRAQGEANLRAVRNFGK